MTSLKEHFYRLLRFSERYTKTDMVYATGGGFWLVAAQLAATLFSVPLSIAFANLLSQTDFGVYKYALALAGLVGAFTLTGIPLAISRAAARGFDGTLTYGFNLNLKTSWFSALIALAGALYYALHANQILCASLVIIAVATPFFSGSGYFVPFLNGAQQFKVASSYNTLRNLCGSAAILITLLVFPHPLVVLCVYFASYTLSGLFFHYRTLRLHSKHAQIDPEARSIALHASLSNGVLTAVDQLDKILLFQFIGAAQLAIYSFAEIVPEAINRLLKSVSPLALPKYARQQEPVGLIRKSLLLSLLFAPVTLGYILAAPFIFDLFFPLYKESIPFTQALAFLFLLSGVLPSAYLDAQGAVKARHLVTIVTSIVKIALTVLGILFYGLWGAVLARLVSKVFNSALILFVIKAKIFLRH